MEKGNLENLENKYRKPIRFTKSLSSNFDKKNNKFDKRSELELSPLLNRNIMIKDIGIRKEERQIKYYKQLKKSLNKGNSLYNKLFLSKGLSSILSPSKSEFKSKLNPKSLSIQRSNTKKRNFSKPFIINPYLLKGFYSANSNDDDSYFPKIFKMQNVLFKMHSKRHSKDSFDLSNINNNF